MRRLWSQAWKSPAQWWRWPYSVGSCALPKPGILWAAIWCNCVDASLSRQMLTWDVASHEDSPLPSPEHPGQTTGSEARW